MSGLPSDCSLYPDCSINDCIDELEPTEFVNMHLNGKQCRLFPACPLPKISLLGENSIYDVDVLPIPARDKLMIHATSNIDFEKIEIYNSIGIIVLENNMIDRTGKEFEISIGSLIPGVYYLLLSTEYEVFRKKFIVK